MAMQAPPENQSVMSKIFTELKDIRDRHFKDERFEEEVSPFANLDKAAVLQDCRVFHDAAFVRMHPKRCCQQITRLLYFLTQGETFTGPDAEEVFFGVTKLFQSQDGNLRRMVYLFLKAVAESTDASSLIIVTQSLVKDMFNETPLYKGNALRVLSSIVDASMLGQLERYYKQAIVDRDEYVSSAALVSSLLLSSKQGAGDVIARWVNEVQTTLTSSKGDMVTFHSLALLRSIKRHDKLAVSKVVLQLMRGPMRSPLGTCLLIRYTQSLLAGDTSPATQQALYEFLEGAMRHKSEMVVFEAARAVCSLPSVSSRDLGPAITMLHMFLASPKPALRFAAVRTLHRLAAAHAAVVAKCNDDLEALIADPNRSVGTLAITTLLKTGGEASVDRLMKQIGSFMVDVGSDELKVVVVQAIHELALRLPSKHRAIMAFLANALREEGGYEFKKAILDGLLDIMEVIPEAKNEGLFHLCEFIEDCEFTSLATRVLHLLGDAGPSAPAPASFIRFIYNRVILENAPVRASAVSALAKFASRCEELRPSIIPLLTRCLDDDDDEVRDRSTMFLTLLGGANPASATAAASAAAGVGGSGSLSARAVGSTPATAAAAVAAAASAALPSKVDSVVSRSLTSGRLPLPVAALQKALALYQLRPSPGPFSFAALPHVEIPAPPPGGPALDVSEGYGYASEIRSAESNSGAAKVARAKARLNTSMAEAASGDKSGGDKTGPGGSGDKSGGDSAAAEALYRIPEFKEFGPLFRSSKPVELTEAELEYLVTVQKHIFTDAVVFAFTVRNTVPEVLMERVTVAMTPSEPGAWRHVVTIAAPKIREGAPGTAYVAWARSPDAGFGSSSFKCELKFNNREFDTVAGEAVGDASPEDYPLDPVEISPADFVAPVTVPEFRSAWEALGSEGEILESYGLSFKTVAEAVSAVVDTLGMAPCEGTGVVKQGTTKHNAYTSGVFLGGVKVLARLMVTVDPDAGGCVLKIAIRSQDRDVSQLLMETIS